MNSSSSACRLFCLTLLPFLIARAEAGQYFQDFTAAAEGATNFGDGSSFFSTIASPGSGVIDATYKELQFTHPSLANSRSAFILPALEPAAPVTALSVKFNAVIYGTYPNAGEGFSLSFGQFAANSNLISTSFFQETGYTNGLCFSVRTQTAPGFYLRLDGQTIASITNNPTTQWGVNNPARHYFEIDWNASSGVTVRMDHQTIFTNVAVPNFVPRNGDRFVFAARTSLSPQYFRIDNVLALTGGNLRKLPVGSPFYKDANFANYVENAFNDDFNSPYSTSGTQGYAGGTLGASKNVKVYAITTDESTFAAAQPQTWRLEGSSNGVTWSASNPLTTGRFINARETRAWLATDATDYPAWRLNVITNSGSIPEVAIEELELYEVTPEPPEVTAVNDQGNFRFFTETYCVQPQSFVFTVYPKGGVTSVLFEWGLTTAYGNTFNTTVPATNGAVTVSAPLGLPEGGKDYHYRITVQSPGGTMQTADQVFHLPSEHMFNAVNIFGREVLNNAVLAADFNDDGKLDILNSGFVQEIPVSGSLRTGASYIWINNVDGSAGPSLGLPRPFWKAEGLYMSQHYFVSDGAVVVNDFNNDSRLDVYMNGWQADFGDNHFYPDVPFRQFLYPGYEPKIDPVGAHGVFLPATANRLQLPTVPNNLWAGAHSRASTADFNGDGRVDLLLANTWPPGSTLNNYDFNSPPPPTLYLNRAHGYYTNAAGVGGPQRPGLDQFDFVPVVSGLPFSTVTFYATNGLTNDLYFGNRTIEADYDHDGDIDVYNCTAEGGLYQNNGYGQFTLNTNLPFGAQNAVWGDFNNDGKLDVVLALSAESRLYRNDGGGNFTDMGLSFPGGDIGLPDITVPAMAWADIDHNGWLDLYARGFIFIENNAAHFNLVYFNSNGVFTAHSILKPSPSKYDFLGGGFSRNAVTFADFNGDGRLDIGECGSAGVSYLLPQPSSLWFVYNLRGGSNQPPDAPIGLSSSSSAGSVSLNWGNAIDDVTPSAALSYNLRVGTSPGQGDIVSSLSKTNGFRLVSAVGNSWLAHTRTLRLPPGTYYWSVQAVDAAFSGGPFAAEQSFTITNPGTSYIYGSEVSNVASNSATVSAGIWTSYQDALCWIEYGLTPAYGQSASRLLNTDEDFIYQFALNTNEHGITTPFQAISQHTTSFNLSSLLSGRDYHYRFAVSNSVGVVYGQDAVFTTLGDAPPKLLVTLTNGSVRLSWTNSDSNFSLQERPDLTTSNWTPVALTPVNTNGMFQVTIPPGSPTKFFQLTKP